jgi:CheY-like chemotaxis protein
MMDLHMPGMDGLETTRRIRALPSDRPQAYILALTSDLTDGSRQRCALAGIEHILGKPLQLASLRRMLASVSDKVIPVAQSPESADRTALVDSDFYEERREIFGITELTSLALMFRRASRPMVEAILAAAARGDRRQLERHAHQLNSSAGALGLLRLAHSAAAIEASTKTNLSISSLTEMVKALPALRQASVKALLTEMRRSAAQFASVQTPGL